MDAAELILLLRDADDEHVGKLINRFADSYRRGESLRTLVPLLKDPDPKLVGAGAWIASEVVDGIRGREIFEDLSVLLSYEEPEVRFWVIQSIALLVRPDEPFIIRELFLLSADSNLAVRRQALYWLCRIPESIIASLRDSDIWPGARLLLGNAGKDEIRAAIKSTGLFNQRMAVAGAMRNFGDDGQFVQELLPSLDDEVVASLARLRM